MVKSAKRILAAFLAVLMVFALGTAASASPANAPQQERSKAVSQAPAEGTITITQQPRDMPFEMYVGEPDLVNLEFSVKGGIFTQETPVIYNQVAGDTIQKENKVLWNFWVRPKEGDWKVGSNVAVLNVWATKCIKFNEVIVDEATGTPYGYFDEELVFDGYVEINVTATAFQGGGAAIALVDSADVALDELIDYGNGYTEYYGNQLFTFKAPSDGFYSFKSTGGKLGGTYYSKEGDEKTFEGVYPRAFLYDANGDYLGGGYGRYDGENFAIYREMKKDEVIFLDVFGWADAPSKTITVTATREGDTQPKLVLKNYDIKAVYREFISIDDLLKDTGLTWEDVWVECDWEYLNDWGNRLAGIKRGTTTITINAPDGRQAQVKITISYSPAQWLCIIFLGGWSWMSYTSYGKFNLWNEIKNLLDNGLIPSLYTWLANLFINLGYALRR